MMDKVALAMTINPTRPTGVKNPAGDPLVVNDMTQITLCPWFVDWVKERKFKLSSDGLKQMVAKKVIQTSQKPNSRLGFAQIDAFSLLDKVLLHEMTHGRAIFRASVTDRKTGKVEHQDGLIDASAMSGWLSLGLFEWSAYGWKLARALAMRGDPLGYKEAPDNNSDTIALFASVCSLMNDPTTPRKVDDKGRIVPLNQGG
ncbi:hypothetical protein FB567DRAFT_552087 [Paraphoma chrysanthemicola]|uniref:Uncharacterized protein n=1 Tax=Paraphoma chrysanthemicola TaxID=798071 RepID=A0A8K0QZX4_9PLEO|nr:hypothetical protein FB567DRAFT_552087 [Paraphoma chrysanthemicola]